MCVTGWCLSYLHGPKDEQDAIFIQFCSFCQPFCWFFRFDREKLSNPPTVQDQAGHLSSQMKGPIILTFFKERLFSQVQRASEMSRISDISGKPLAYSGRSQYSRLQPTGAEKPTSGTSSPSSPIHLAQDRFVPSSQSDSSTGLAGYRPLNPVRGDANQQISSPVPTDVRYDNIFTRNADGMGKDSTSLMPKECKT
jgi:hypothetical protein